MNKRRKKTREVEKKQRVEGAGEIKYKFKRRHHSSKFENQWREEEKQALEAIINFLNILREKYITCPF